MIGSGGWIVDVVLASAVIGAAYLTRRIPSYLGITGSDAWTHEFYVKVLRESEDGIPEKVSGFFFEAKFEYPWLLHWLLARVPRRWFERHKGRISPLVAAATAGFCYGAGMWVGVRAGLSTVESRWVGATAGGLYLVTPMTYNAWSGIHDFSERPVAVLLMSASGVGAALASSGGGAGALALWMIGSSLVPLSSKFGVQALVLVFPLAGILSGDAYLLATPLAALVGATLVSGGHYLRIAKGHLSKMRFYRECLQWRHVGVLRRNSGVAATLKRCLAALRSLRMKAVLRELAYNPVFRALLYFPFIVLVIGAVAGSPGTAVVFSLLWLTVVSFAVGLVVATVRPLRFIGEGDRYLYYAGVVPSCLGLAVLSRTGELGSATASVAVLALLIGAAELISRSRRARSGRTEDSSLEGALDVIRESDAEGVLAIPSNYAMAVRLFTDKDVVFWANPSQEERDLWEALHPRYYPYPREDLLEGRRLFGFDSVLVVKRFVRPEYLSELNLDISYRFEGWRLAYEDDAAEIWRPRAPEE